MKTCFKCNRELPRSEFYAHPQMGDGLLGKCKECTRADTAKREERLMSDPELAEKERERHRRKSKKSREQGMVKRETTEEARERTKTHRKLYPHKYKARQMVGNRIRDGKLFRQSCMVCGKKAQAHHDDYTKPLDVMWLCPKHHGERHVELNRLARQQKQAI